MQPSQPQSEWNVEFQRHLRTQWDPQNQRYYRESYDSGRATWVFFDWLPTAPRVDSGNYTEHYKAFEHEPNNGYQAPAGPSGPASGQRAYNSPGRKGATILGTYTTTNPQHREPLDSAFEVKHSSFFKEGTVFAVLFTEPAGNTTQAYNDSISIVLYGENVHTQIRRFIVVGTRKGRGFSFACPIFTYGNQGTKKRGVNVQEHAIAYSEGHSYGLVEGEQNLTKEPICVKMIPSERNSPLSRPSRICFGIHHPIQHNVKVKHIGQVRDQDIPNLLGYWKMENSGFANNPAEATAEALETSPVVQKDPYLYDAAKNQYGYDTQINPHMYHPTHNPSGYHPTYNVSGYHPHSNPHMYHPTHNVHGYHKEKNPSGHHPKKNEHGYHPVHNPYGYHAAKAPFCYHPQSNPRGYHAHYNPQGYHPHSNKYCYHLQSNPFGYHPQDNVWGYHDQLNPYGYHGDYNPNGYHPQYRPNVYHPIHNPVVASQEESDDEDDESDGTEEDEPIVR